MSPRPTPSTARAALALGLAVAFLWSCSNTNFASSSAKKGGKSADASRKGKDDGGDGGDGVDTGRDEDLGTTGKDGGDTDASGGNGKDGGTDTDQANADGGGLIETEECLKKKADNYNIALVFDNSGSQRFTDPQSVRRDGALTFVDQFSSYVAKNKKARVYMVVTSFNTQSVRGQKGWVRLTGDNAADVKTEITNATSNPNGGTAYSPALQDAAAYFDQITKSVPQERTKNYTVFLTDGLPNAASGMNNMFFPGGLGGLGGLVEKMEDIPVAVDHLVNDYQVAMVAIASGNAIPPEGEQITQSLAKPQVGVKDKSHVGLYRRAATAEQLKAVWEQLFADIGNCE